MLADEDEVIAEIERGDHRVRRADVVDADAQLAGAAEHRTEGAQREGGRPPDAVRDDDVVAVRGDGGRQHDLLAGHARVVGGAGDRVGRRRTVGVRQVIDPDQELVGGDDRERAGAIGQRIVIGSEARRHEHVGILADRVDGGVGTRHRQRAAEDGRRLAVDKPFVADAGEIRRVGDADQLGVVVGRDDERRLGDGQRPVDVGQGVVARTEAAGSDRIAAGADGVLRVAAVREGAGQERRSLPVDEPRVRRAGATDEGEAIVGLRRRVGGDGQRGLVDGERAAGETDRVIRRGQPGGRERIAARVHRALGRAAVGQDPAKDGGALGVDEAGVGDAIAAGVSEPVVGLRSGVRRHGERDRADGQRAGDEIDEVVARSQATGRDRITARVDRSLGRTGVGERAAEHRRGLGVDEADVGHAVATGVSEPVIGFGSGVRRHRQRSGGDDADAARSGRTRQAVTVDGCRAGAVGRGEIGEGDARDADRDPCADILRRIGAGGRHRPGEGDGVAAHDPGEGVIGRSQVGRRRQAVVGLADRVDQRDRQVRRVGVDQAVTRAQQARTGARVGEVILLVVIRQATDHVARGQVEGIGVGAPDAPAVRGAWRQGEGSRLVDETSGGESDVPGEGQRRARSQRRGRALGQVVDDLGRLDRGVEGDAGGVEGSRTGVAGVIPDLGDLQRVRDDDVAVGLRREGHRSAVGQRHHAEDGARADDRVLRVQVDGLRRQADEADRHDARVRDRQAVGAHDLGGEINEDLSVHRTRLVTERDAGVGGSVVGGETAGDRGVMGDRAAAGLDGQAVSGAGRGGIGADVAVESDGASPGGERPGDRRGVGRVVKVEVARVVD